MAEGTRTAVAVARRAAGMTQAELAVAVGASPRTIVRVEKGDVRPRLELAVRLAQVLGLTLEDFL
jgi:putative transcriptional regulator